MVLLGDQAAGLRRLVQRGGTAPLSHQKVARLAVASGKGGVGKTNLVVNLAIAFAQRGRRVLVYDADLGLANVDVLMGLAPRRRLDQVVAEGLDWREAIVEGLAGVLVVPGASGVPMLADAGGGLRRRLTASLAALEGLADTLIVDTAAGIGQTVVEFLAEAGEALVVTTPEPTGLADAYALIKVTYAAAPQVAFSLVINQAEGEAEAVAAGQRIVETSRRYLGCEVTYLGYVPRDISVVDAVKRKVPLLLAYPGAAASRAIVSLAERLAHGPLGGAT